MVNYVSDNMDDIYKNICTNILKNGKQVKGTKELNNFSFKLTNLNNNVINVRNISKAYLCAELTWYMLARKDVAFINPFAGLWGRISDDGVNSYSAYGDIVFNRHGFDQIDKVIELLSQDPDSRRAVVNFNVPNANVIETKDEICTIALQFLIREGKLNCTGIMRSNDIWFGLPYDTVFFTEIQKYIAHRLNIEVGYYIHDVVSLHCYKRNYNDVEKVIYAMATEKISIDIEKLDMYKRIIEAGIKDEVDTIAKKELIVTICKTLDVLKVEPINLFEALAYTE